MICENCGKAIPEDRIHHADPYEKGVCDVFSIVKDSAGKPIAGVATGWSRARNTVDFNKPNIEGWKKLDQ